MTRRRIRPMTAADLSALPEPSARCAFGEARPAEPPQPAANGDRARAKMELAGEVTAHWGYCGVLAVDDDRVIGFLTVSPSASVPRVGAFAAAPASPGVAAVLTVQVVEGYRGVGVGRQLVQSAASLLVRRDIKALEAIGTYRRGRSCLPPVGFLEAVGFAVVRPHPITPRLQMNLHTTLRWKPDLGAAWSRLTDLVSSPSPVEPTVSWRAQPHAS